MSYIPPIYKFADPEASSYRFYYITKCLFNDDLEGKLKNPYKKVFAEVKENALGKSQGIAPLELYRRGHEVLAKNLDKLKEYKLIIVPGVSVNITPEENILGEKPATLGMDFFSDNIRLPDDIMLAYKKALGDYIKGTGRTPKNYEHELIIPWAHFIMPLRILRRDDGVFGIKPFFDAELEKITNDMHARGRFGFGTRIRWADTSDKEYCDRGVEGNYEFSEKMFLGTCKADKKYAYVNRFNSARVLLRLIQTCGKIYWLSQKTNYMGEIKKRLPKDVQTDLIKLIGGDEGIMRRAQLSRMGVSDMSAMKINAGFLYRTWLQENKAEVLPKSWRERNARLFA